MKKHTDKTKSDDAEKTRLKTPQKNPGIQRQGAKLEQRKKLDLKTADKILLYMQEEKF